MSMSVENKHIKYNGIDETVLMESRMIPNFDDCMDLCSKYPISFKFIDDTIDGATFRTFHYTDMSIDKVNDNIKYLSKYSRNLRGIVFNLETKELLALPVFKFFNYNQNIFTAAEFVNTWKVKSIYEKVDGSLIYFIINNDKIYPKTKQSFDNIMTNLAKEVLDNRPILKAIITDFIVNKNCTPMFELVSPINRIVVNYSNTDLIFICVRNNITGDILYVDELLNIENIIPYNDTTLDLTLNTLINSNKLRTVKTYHNTLAQILDKCNVSNDIDINEIEEGFVVKFTNGEIIKIKYLDYVIMHKTRDNMLNDRIIVDLILENKLDDVLPKVQAMSEVLKFIQEIKELVHDTLIITLEKGKNFYKQHKHLDRADFAKAVNSLYKNSKISTVAFEHLKYNTDDLDKKSLDKLLINYKANRCWRKEMAEKNGWWNCE